MKLSKFIRTNMEPILDQWERFASDLLSANQMGKAALRDHASGMLRTIADDLDRLQTSYQQSEKSEGRGPQSVRDTQAELHGAARLLSGFSVSEEVSEFRALRASVLRLWTDSNATAAKTTSDELIRFNEGIDQALAESITRYSFDKTQYARLFDTLLSSSPDLSYLFDLDGKFIYANKSFKSLFGTLSGDIVGKHFLELGPPFSTQIQQQLHQVTEAQKTSRAEMSLTQPSGENVTYENLLVPVSNDEGHPEAIAGIARDITERKEEEDKFRRSANYDSLTNLPNRNFFRDRLEWEVRHSGRTGRPVALLFLDLDGFKAVNDRLGHDAGDQLLQQVALRISACVRCTDTVARLGGDEFTVIISEVNKTQHVEILAQEILEELARPFSILQTDVHISGSIGITLFPQDADTPENLVRNADQAMYVAKNAGRNRFSFFAIGMRDSAWARLKMIDELREALPQRQLSVYYQPIVDLSLKRIVKAEALLRWQHPQTGLLLPGEFIGLAEEIGLIGDIDDWVLGEAMVSAREWSTLVGAPFQISVNKSPLEFMSSASVASWDSHLEALGLAWNSISVEITEGVLLEDSPRVTERLKNLQKAGVQLSIDDFGSGYSSMTYLKKFDVDYLKIDQSFVQDTAMSRNSRIIAEAIIVMAHKLGLQVIAEGVETAEQSDWLQAAGCDYAQGYFFSEPVPVQQFENLLRVGKAQQLSNTHLQH
jgi:diguanylate cyclase (GGDEF)-like protein/PAS domain S-box-containing protein